jgi:hypothetical protein
MTSLRSLLDSSTAWISNYDMRPSSLFEGVAQRLSIVLQHFADSGTKYSGGYRRWSTVERDCLLANTRFVQAESKGGVIIPKIVTPIEASILAKLGTKPLRWVVQDDAPPIYIHRIVRYFIKALDKAPLFIDAKGEKGKSEDYKPFSFCPELRSYIVPLLNSSLFYWYWRTHSDGFHCGYGDVYRMPIMDKLAPATMSTLDSLGKTLQRDLLANSSRKQIKTKTGKITYQEFYPKLSKGILDQIDATLAKHYGFSSEELDFIVNYDCKYRLGADGDNE